METFDFPPQFWHRHGSMQLRSYLAVMFVGAFGCAARMWLVEWLRPKCPSFPIGTLAVNIIGCLIIGFFEWAARDDGPMRIPPVVRHAVTIGFLGGFTTFSSFAVQTLTLFQEKAWGLGMLNIVLSVTLCLLAVWVGYLLGRQWIG